MCLDKLVLFTSLQRGMNNFKSLKKMTHQGVMKIDQRGLGGGSIM